MTAIDNNNFSFKRVKDRYILTSKTNSPQNYILTLLKCDDDSIIVEEGVLEDMSLPEGIVYLTVLKDGFYTLNVNGVTIYFSNWKGHRSKLIPLIKRTLCENCGCKPVNCMPKEAIDCLRNQSLFTFIQTYTYLIKPYSVGVAVENNPTIFDFLQRNTYSNKCFMLLELCKQLLETCIEGETNTNQKLFNYFIATHYLALYYYDITNINPSILTTEEVVEELKYIDKVYEFKHIKKCITALGINIDNVINVDTTNINIHYWQLNNPVDAINEVLPLLSDSYLNGQPTQSYSVFKDGFTVPAINIGRLVFVVRETSLQNFILLDSLGNDVTDEFDTAYNNTLSAAVFVSKDYYSNGNYYFKFKTIFDV